MYRPARWRRPARRRARPGIVSRRCGCRPGGSVRSPGPSTPRTCGRPRPRTASPPAQSTRTRPRSHQRPPAHARPASSPLFQLHVRTFRQTSGHCQTSLHVYPRGIFSKIPRLSITRRHCVRPEFNPLFHPEQLHVRTFHQTSGHWRTSIDVYPRGRSSEIPGFSGTRWRRSIAAPGTGTGRLRFTFIHAKDLPKFRDFHVLAGAKASSSLGVQSTRTVR